MKDIGYKQLKIQIENEINNNHYCDRSSEFDAITPISVCAEEFTVSAYEGKLNRIKDKCKLVPYTEITGNLFLKFIKRMIKSLTNYFVRPLVDCQNDLNEHYASLFALTLGQLQKEIYYRERLEKELEVANKKIDRLEQIIKDM